MVSIQEYDFEVEHIKGVENKVADAFSRLCGLRRDVRHGLKESNLEKIKEKSGTNDPCSRRKAISKAQRKKGKTIP